MHTNEEYIDATGHKQHYIWTLLTSVIRMTVKLNTVLKIELIPCQ